MQGVFLLAVVAFAAFCNAHDHPLTNCTVDIDCQDDCPYSVGVCSPPQNHCHCHDFGEITCKTDEECEKICISGFGCCHNYHHCHCDEICGHHHD